MPGLQHYLILFLVSYKWSKWNWISDIWGLIQQKVIIVIRPERAQNDTLVYRTGNSAPTQDTASDSTALTGLHWAAQLGDKPTAFSPKYKYKQEKWKDMHIKSLQASDHLTDWSFIYSAATAISTAVTRIVK